jgi:hypothetical protein
MKTLITPVFFLITNMSNESKPNINNATLVIQQDSCNQTQINVEQQAYLFRLKKKGKNQINHKHSIKTEIKAINAVCFLDAKASFLNSNLNSTI